MFTLVYVLDLLYRAISYQLTRNVCCYRWDVCKTYTYITFSYSLITPTQLTYSTRELMKAACSLIMLCSPKFCWMSRLLAMASSGISRDHSSSRAWLLSFQEKAECEKSWVWRFISSTDRSRLPWVFSARRSINTARLHQPHNQRSLMNMQV